MTDLDALDFGEAGFSPPSEPYHGDGERAGRGGWAASLAGRAGDWLGTSLDIDLAAGRGFLWIPVAGASGIVLYFALPAEPSLIALALAAAGCAGAAVALRAGSAGGHWAAVLAAAFFLGALAAKIETERAAAPVLAREATLRLTGFVADRDLRPGGRVRLVIEAVRLDRVAPARTPRRVRVTAVASAAVLRVGDGVRLLVRLSPPAGPDAPGSYDAARDLYLAGIGATGFVYGRPEQVDLGPPPARLRLAAAIAEMRETLAARIRAALPGAPGEIAVALIAGERGGIDPAIEDSMRASGLTHVLSISGLHMTLVAGTILAVLRAGMAAVPGLALRRPIKAWAALAALPAAAFYMVLAGSDPATERSFVMIAIALLAVALGRPALTLRTVALAALAVMAARPSSVLNAGFQMSFAAVIALVAAFEAIAARRRRQDDAEAPSWLGAVVSLGPGSGAAAKGVRFVVLWGFGLVATSLLAGLASGPIAAYHFHRAAPLSLVANLAAAPVISLVIMPAAVLSVVAMPFGLESLPLAAMGAGIEIMVAISDRVAAWTGDMGRVGYVPLAGVLALVAALLWAALTIAPWRRLALVPASLALILFVTARPPDLWVAADGRMLAWRNGPGRLAVVAPERRGERPLSTWLAMAGDPRLPRDKSLVAAARCGPVRCTLDVPRREGSPVASKGSGQQTDVTMPEFAGTPDAARALRIVLLRNPAGGGVACADADIVVTPFARPPDCRTAIVVDGPMLARGGALAIRVDNTADPPRILAVLTSRTIGRPWTSPTSSALAERGRRESSEPAPAP
ncbi:ComEC/Rec2 family competence protein [Segnochrobactrum spirostomi]|uniref:ComEC/Rec2 family competence protein n=1 Tax=Segnochrobactrum spirostomi TaxID=2608987 RepID=UPI001AD83F00|nr:ComEC/Rec2 family competence protein [Segnochrobactrum spirostomi]